MTSAYSRLYHRLMTEYPSVWTSDKQLALFVRLLVMAEKFYPEWPTPNRRNGAYQSLVKAGLVIEKKVADADFRGIARPATDSYVYSIRGLQAERERRSHAASNAAASRWGMPRRDETRRDKNISADRIVNGSPGPLPPKSQDSRAEGLWHHGQHPNCSTCQQFKAAR